MRGTGDPQAQNPLKRADRCPAAPHTSHPLEMEEEGDWGAEKEKERVSRIFQQANCYSQRVHPKGNQSWIATERTDAEAETTWCEELNHWKRSWFWERLKAGEGDARGWDVWMASLTRWVWAGSRSWWWTGKPGVLQSMRLQRVRHDWVTELNWTETYVVLRSFKNTHWTWHRNKKIKDT